MTYTQTHTHDWPHELDCVDLADDVCLARMATGYLVAFDVEGHDGRQVGSVPTSGLGPTWLEVSGNLESGTLTLVPSIRWQSGAAERHGFVTAGRWMPA